MTRPIMFSVEGHMSDMFRGPVADTATQLEKEGVCYHQPIGYNNGPIPFDNASGVRELARLVGAEHLDTGTPFPAGTPWALGGFSQGGIICTDFWLDFLAPGKPLAWRTPDLVGVLAYGNPCRQTGSLAPWAASWVSRTDTHGLDPRRRFGAAGFPDKPDNWVDVYREGDIFAENGDDEASDLKAAVYQAVARGKVIFDPFGLAAELAEQLRQPVAMVLSIIRAIASGINFAATGPATNAHYSPYDIRGGVDWMRARLANTNANTGAECHVTDRYWPLEFGRIVTSPFGPRDGGFHAGTDFGWPGGSAGKPVFAVQAGVVQYAGAAQGYGGPDPAGWLVIDSADSQGGGCFEYGHIVREVNPGDRVRAGQRIAHINPDSATNGGVAPHLHLAAWQYAYGQGQKIDPLPLLRGAGEPEETMPPLDELRPDHNEYPVWSRNYNDRGGTKIDLWLLHTQEGNGNADSLARWLDANGVSYHYTISEDFTDHGVTVCDVVDTDFACWSSLDANNRSINLCFAGSRAMWTREEWMRQSRAIDVAAYLAVQDCRKYGIPLTVIPPPYGNGRAGISDHQFVTEVLHDGTHTDVGPNFPWDYFAERVEFWANPMPPAPPPIAPPVVAPPIAPPVVPPSPGVLVPDLSDTLVRQFLAAPPGGPNSLTVEQRNAAAARVAIAAYQLGKANVEALDRAGIPVDLSRVWG